MTAEQKAKLTPGQLRALERPREWEQDWVKRIDLDGKVTGVFADYHYVGTGDIGGATAESTVKLLEAIVTKSETVLPPPPRAFGQQDQPGSNRRAPRSVLAMARFTSSRRLPTRCSTTSSRI